LDEIKDCLKVNRGAVDMRKARILQKLKDCFKNKVIQLKNKFRFENTLITNVEFKFKYMQRITILIHCEDQKSIIATVTNYIASIDGNIIYLDQHVDAEVRTTISRSLKEVDLQ
jgi:ACT domain-containing protein